MTDDITERIFPRRQMRLVDLEPEWLGDDTPGPGLLVAGSRFGLGVSFLCPGHMSADHRLELWFINPIDLLAPRTLPVLYYRTGCEFEDLTLSQGVAVVRLGQPVHEAISIEGHWVGYVHGGFVIDALRIG